MLEWHPALVLLNMVEHFDKNHLHEVFFAHTTRQMATDNLKDTRIEPLHEQTRRLFVMAAVAIGAVAGWAGWARLAGVIASFLTNLRVTPSDPMPLVVTSGVILMTALVVFLAGARRV